MRPAALVNALAGVARRLASHRGASFATRTGLALTCALVLSGAARAAVVEGTVVARDGRPLEYANVLAPTWKRAAVTDEQGRFRLELPPGRATLEVTQIGYEPVRLTVVVADQGLRGLRITLREEPIALSEVQVTASSFGKAGKSEGAVVQRMDILMTPGGAADVFQALRGLPGLVSPNEGAALYVRGGDPRETLIRLDGGDVGHPYHYETASGGLFGAFSTYMLKSAFFSSGGFSAKYGGVLSGVLDIETADPMNTRSVSLGANMVGADAYATWRLVPDRLAFVGGIRGSATGILDQLYGSPADYVTEPTSSDGAAKLLWRYTPTGRLSLLYLRASDDVNVITDVLNVTQGYRHRARNQFLALQFQDVLAGRIALRGQVAGQLYHTHWRFGEFGGHNDEDNAQGNVDAVWPLGRRHELAFGLDWRRQGADYEGLAPADSTDLGAGAPKRPITIDTRVDQPGFYLEDKLRVWGRLYATLGGRLDYASRPGTWTADPRGALAYLLDDRQTVRVSLGRFHQLATTTYLDPVYGNPELAPLRADHVVAGYEWKSEHADVRLEAYRKDYRGLVTYDPVTYYANDGTGWARGVDVFVQGNTRDLSGWVSYGYLDSKRRELEATREVPSSYGVRHSVTLVGKYQWTSKWQWGFKWNYATGRPYQPVVDRTYDPVRHLYRPVYGEVNSARMPDYSRLDIRLLRLFSLSRWGRLPESSICAAYVEALNVLNRENLLDYAYSPDYLYRYEELSYFSRRYLVGGLSLTW
jgi:hypothetical protein